MSIIKRNDVLFPSLMNEIFKPDWFGGVDQHSVRVPAVNIRENETGFGLELAVPGLKKDDFNIEIDKDVLTISSEMKSEDTLKDDKFTRKEFSLSSFTRSFTLPETVDSDKIKADYNNGILSFNLPKREDALPKPKRMIEIGK